VSFTVTITFSSAWLGDKTIWGESLDQAKNDSGYQQVGTYTVVHQGPAQDFSVSISPDHLDTTPGHVVTYHFTLTSINGFSGTVACNASANPAPSGLAVFSVLPQGPVPANGTQTGQLTANVSGSTPVTSNVAITLACQDSDLQHNAQTILNIASPETPTVAISPSSGTGSTQTFTITATDPGGFTAIGQLGLLISPSFDGRNACWLFYGANGDPNTNTPSGTLALASDDTSNWSSATDVTSDPAQASPIFNSQCSVFGGPTAVSGSGDTLTLTVTLTFTSAFTGAKNLYVRAQDVGGPDSGYQQLGTFTTQAGNGNPDFEILVSPATQSVTGQGRLVYSATLRGVYGYSGTVDLSVSGLPPNSTATWDPSFPSSIKPNQTAYFYVNTTGDTPTGSYTPAVNGTDGTLTNSQNFGVNVTGAAMPTVSVTPNSGSGTTQNFNFVVTGTSEADPADIDVIFNSSVNGSHACWIYKKNGGTAGLASDDGSLWQTMNPVLAPTAQNSQCTVTLHAVNDPRGQMTLNVTITFNSTFAGTKNIYIYADNIEGGNTGGYQLEGTWTIP
jgi:hypothetical protein